MAGFVRYYLDVMRKGNVTSAASRRKASSATPASTRTNATSIQKAPPPPRKAVVTIDDVRAVAQTLPRSYEVYVGGRVKFRVGRLVYLSFSKDQAVMGFAFPREQREWLIGGSPEKFMFPIASDMRYHWVLARLAALEPDEMRELVIDAWRMVVPRSVAAAYRESR